MVEKKFTAEMTVDVKQARKSDRIQRLAFEMRLSQLAHKRFLENQLLKDFAGIISKE